MKGAETIVIGGGIVGATTLWELAREGMEPLLLEAHAFGEQSTGKSAAIVRCHYSNPEVVRMAVHSRERLRQLPLHLDCDPVYTRCGWLFLVDEESADAAAANADMQEQEGLDLVEVSDLQESCPVPRNPGSRTRCSSRTPATPTRWRRRAPTSRRRSGRARRRSKARRSAASRWPTAACAGFAWATR